MTHKGTAFITGGAKRIGKALALALAAKGYHIALHYHHSEKEAEEVAALVRHAKGECQTFQADLQDFSTLEPLVKNIFATFPDCNLLINNASIFEQCSFIETTEEIFDRHMAINFKAPYFLTQAFAKHCAAGQVVNIIDSYVTKNKTPYFAYLLSKKALLALTQMAAMELGPALRVNGISPGITEISHEVRPDWLAKKTAVLPLQTIVKVSDIIAAVVQLTESPYLTGQVLSVDGGEHLL